MVSVGTVKEKCKRMMKKLDAAKLKDMAEAIASKTMLAVMAMLCIRFIRTYMAASVRFQTVVVMPLFTFACARKRVTGRVTHERKFALFTGCTETAIIQDIKYGVATCY